VNEVVGSKLLFPVTGGSVDGWVPTVSETINATIPLAIIQLYDADFFI
jgi:hypothetical protein